MSPAPKTGTGGGLSLLTLAISSLSAAAAAIIVPLFWQRGSVIATAVTPIVVALVAEAIGRPARAIRSVATSPPGAATAPLPARPSAPARRGERVRAGQRQAPPRHAGGISPEDPFGLREALPPVADRDEPRYRQPGAPRDGAPNTAGAPRRRPGLRLAVVTGLIAALIGAGTVTASELAIFRHSVGQSNRATGLWGGTPERQSPHKATPTATPDAKKTATPSATSTRTPTATPSATDTATPTPTPSATPTVVPSSDAAPQQATPEPSTTPAAPTPTPTA